MRLARRRGRRSARAAWHGRGCRPCRPSRPASRQLRPRQRAPWILGACERPLHSGSSNTARHIHEPPVSRRCGAPRSNTRMARGPLPPLLIRPLSLCFLAVVVCPRLVQVGRQRDIPCASAVGVRQTLFASPAHRFCGSLLRGFPSGRLRPQALGRVRMQSHAPGPQPSSRPLSVAVQLNKLPAQMRVNTGFAIGRDNTGSAARRAHRVARLWTARAWASSGAMG
jgi:hypothetical protein